MCGPPDPEMRSPAVTSGRANRKASKPGRLKKIKYASSPAVASFAVCQGREPLGHILETDAGLYRAVAPNGLLIGSYPSRLEAAKAFSGVRS
jgi:hypothetical protein